MAEVFLSLGSNVHKEHHIRSALDALTHAFGKLNCSSVYESEAVGFEGEHFYNLVVSICTTLAPGKLSSQLRQIEEDNDRNRSAPRFSARTLDIDILDYNQYDGSIDGIDLPREEILYNAFVLKPLAELAPNHCHAISGKTYASLWQAFDQNSQKLWVVPFVWQNVDLSNST